MCLRVLHLGLRGIIWTASPLRTFLNSGAVAITLVWFGLSVGVQAQMIKKLQKVNRCIYVLFNAQLQYTRKLTTHFLFVTADILEGTWLTNCQNRVSVFPGNLFMYHHHIIISGDPNSVP